MLISKTISVAFRYLHNTGDTLNEVGFDYTPPVSWSPSLTEDDEFRSHLLFFTNDADMEWFTD